MRKEYQEILQACYEAIGSFNIAEAETLYLRCIDGAVKLTNPEKKYIINKINSFRMMFYEKYLSDYASFSALNNNYITPAVTRKLCMYIRCMPDNHQKGIWVSKLYRRVAHNKNKYGKDEYRTLLENIYTSAFPYFYEV